MNSPLHGVLWGWPDPERPNCRDAAGAALCRASTGVGRASYRDQSADRFLTPKARLEFGGGFNWEVRITIRKAHSDQVAERISIR